MKKTIFILLISVLLASCDTDSFLDVKPTGKLIPETVADFDKLLENPSNQYYAYRNTFYMDPDVELGPNGDQRLWSLSMKRQYEWAEHIFNEDENDYDWNYNYQYIYIHNMILGEIDDAPLGTASEGDRVRIKAEALAMRAMNLYILVNEYAAHYDANNLDAPGVPMPLEINLQAQLPRTPIGEIYTQIEGDLETAASVLMEKRPGRNDHANFRPGYASILGLQAEIALRKGEFAKAAQKADAALAQYSFLYDMTTWTHKYEGNPWGGIEGDNGNDLRYQTANKETIWNKSSMFIYGNPGVYWNMELEDMMDQVNDMRYVLFSSKIDYYGTDISPYTSYATYYQYRSGGITVPKLYLISAEGKARTGDGAGALAMLDILRNKRIKNNTPLTFVDNASALQTVKNERRKELVFTCNNFQDLKRYHSYGDIIPTYTRTINDQVHTLAPGSDKYIVPIPRKIIKFNPNLDID